MKPFSLNIAQAALAASLFLCCAEVPEELANPNNGPYSSSSAGLHSQPSSSSSLRQSSSGGESPGELLCSSAPEAGAEGEALRKPTVTCGGVAVSASSWAGSPHAPDWDSPKEGSYSGIVAIAACGGSSKMADCPGLLTVIPAKLACGAVPSTAVEGMPVTKPAVLCDGIAVPAESWQPASLSWSSPEEGVYSSIKATAKCGGISKTVACSGTLAVVPPGGVLTCDAVPSTGAAGVSITPPAVKCDGAAVSSGIAWEGAPNWGNPSANSYGSVKAKASCGGSSKTANCSGTLAVVPAALTCASLPSAGFAGAAIAPPAVKCDGAAVSAANVDWSSGAPAWGNPSAGSYSGVTATAICGGISRTASCSGTLKVSANALTCSWAGKPASISQGSALASNERPAASCGNGTPANPVYTPSVSAPFSTVGSIAVSVTATCGGVSQAAQCGTLAVIAPSSSSAAPSSSSGGYAGSYGSLAYQGRTYKTVAIGGQVWMAENLNYDVAGSACYDNSTANCTKYGRLYDWATAMALPSACNTSSCASSVSSRHQGICPSGWHIPTNAEWDALYRYVDGTSGTSSPYGSSTAGKHLKATSGWYDWDGYSSGNGLDTYGFAALPGGEGYPDGYFYNAGLDGYWWSASENISDAAYIRYMLYGYEDAKWNRHSKTKLYSVRCLQDNSIAPPSSSSSSVVPSSSSVTPSSSSVLPSSSSRPSITYGSVTYGGQAYKTVQIGTQNWMAENLDYNVSGSKCYGNSNSNCATYGRLYDWSTAMVLPSSCNSSACASQVSAKHRGICPSGWHIPSGDDWNVLIKFIHEDNGLGSFTSGSSSYAGRYLKSASGWNDYNGQSGNGTDAYGFAALPGGLCTSDGYFSIAGNYGDWWSTSERDSNNAYMHSMRYDNERAGWGYGSKTVLHSVRCLQD